MNKNTIFMLISILLGSGVGYAYGNQMLGLVPALVIIVLLIAIAIYISASSGITSNKDLINGLKAVVSGKGFAVVANEVRKLAEESRLASEYIIKIVNEVVKETELVVEQTSTLRWILLLLGSGTKTHSHLKTIIFLRCMCHWVLIVHA